MDDELYTLKDIESPISETAKRKALQAAQHAFEEAQQSIFQNSEKKSQGFSTWLRLIHSTNQQLWSSLMKKQLFAGTALAGILALGVMQYHGSGIENIATSIEHKDKAETKGIAQNNIKPSSKAALQGIAAEEMVAADMAMPAKEKSVTSLTAATPQQAQPMRKRSEVQASRAMNAQQGMALSNIAPTPKASSLYAPGQIDRPFVDDHPIAQTANNDKFEDMTPNAVKSVEQEPVSTFSIDVDTAAYAYVRRSLNQGRLPNKDAVRIEEMINYFDYDYPLPDNASEPFKPSVSVYPTPWNEDTKLLHIGLQGHDIQPAEQPRSNLVFLLDVSGSMNAQGKLPLLKNAFRLLVDNLNPDDTVSIVTYAGRAGTVLEPTKAKEKDAIFTALENLNAGGSTAGAQGIKQAYNLAAKHYDKEGVNRVILATDGDFNVGISDPEKLKEFIADKRDTGIFLSVLGFGQGNYQDALMQALAQNGNGNAAYIDTLNEARKVLVEEANSTLFPIAKDVKIQIEFNPSQVAEYRLIGYENRMLNREDFNNDKIDAGDIGSGHNVTAIYEITPVGSKAQLVDDLRYQAKEEIAKPDDTGEYAFLKLRYKLPEQSTSNLMQLPITRDLEQDSVSDNTEFATAVAAFGQLLRGDTYMNDYEYDDVIAMASKARGDDPFGYRAEFVNLVRLAKSLK